MMEIPAMRRRFVPLPTVWAAPALTFPLPLKQHADPPEVEVSRTTSALAVAADKSMRARPRAKALPFHLPTFFLALAKVMEEDLKKSIQTLPPDENCLTDSCALRHQKGFLNSALSLVQLERG